MTGLFLLLFYISLDKTGGGHWLKGYGREYPLALILFSFCYWYRERLKPHPVLNFFFQYQLSPLRHS